MRRFPISERASPLRRSACRLDRAAHRGMSRGGWSSWLVICAVLSVSLPLAAWKFVPKFWEGKSTPSFLTASVTSGPFDSRVLEQGEIESSNSVEVRCEVRSRNSTGTNILEIVPEGTRVNEGDFLVRLDDSALQTELIQQQIVASGSESLFIEAEAALEAAKLALNEYEDGTFREQRESLESSLVVANENLRRAEEYVTYSRKLAERGYVSPVQLEADQFAVEKAEKEKGVAATKLEVLDKFTKQKMLTQLQADIKTSAAKLDARRKTWELDKLRLKEIEEQIAKCLIKAPVAGQVVYANDNTRRSGAAELLITEGVPVRERQVLIRLPNPTRMRVLAKVHESRINLVRRGVPAEIITDALPDQVLAGRVTSVSEYPLPSATIYSSHVKEYAVEIEIEAPPEHLRPGMSAQVALLVEHQDSAVQVPIGAVISRADQFFVALPNEDGSFATQKIQVGSANDTSIVVRQGITPGQSVVVNPSEEIQKMLELPEVVRSPASDPVESPHEAAASPKSEAKQTRI